MQRFALRDGEGSNLLLIFDFLLASLRLGSGLVGFSFLFALVVFIGVLIHNTVAVAALYK